MRNDPASPTRADLYVTCEDVPRYLAERGMITPSTAELLSRIATAERVVEVTIHLSQIVRGALREPAECGSNASDDDDPPD